MVRSLPTQSRRVTPMSIWYQRQIRVAFGVLDFIDADGVDLTERAVLHSPSDDMFDRVEHLVPGSAKALCGFFPRKAARPTG
jgi:hypothetical protein